MQTRYMATEAGTTAPDAARWSAVAEWYHAYFTGLVMTMVTRRGAREAAELVFHIFRRQHLERFLPGLEKLGLQGLPPAVAAARYHYLSNAIGGVRVEYMEESPQKAWVRYAPPRWAWHGTAVCAIPGEVSRAVLRGWHAHNGVSLGTQRLGFVCTKQTMDGQPGLEGYYCEYDHDITPDERLRFARGEEAPDFDSAQAPVLLTANWPAERLQKARRNYAMEYVRTALPELIGLHGPFDAAYLGGITGQLIGMQFYSETAAAMGLPDHGDAMDFARFMVALARAQGDEAELLTGGGNPRVRQTSWKLMSGIGNLHGAAFDAWNCLLDGALSAHNRHLALKVRRRLDEGDAGFEWEIAPRGKPGKF
ncbi:hypothetical protein AB4Z48_28440 [Cupriavidus sp. 2TAF22]|uniref:hypothetical protein n=1 Tax=unclassified Cupriavidus TaxID=2640874 RepID=UPI003F9377DA